MVRKVVKDLIKISQPMTWTNSKGFTLIEMMVVIGIIVLISVVSMPTISSYFQLSLNSATRDLATTIKEAYNSTVIGGTVYRLVYDIKDRSFWVEIGSSNVLLDTKESKEKEDKRRKFSSSIKNGKDAATAQDGFSLDRIITRKKLHLPQGVEYEDIMTQQSQNPITEGTAYTHFFPSGLTEQTVIHLKDQSQHHASLVINAMLGSTDLYDRYINAAEAFEKSNEK